MMKVFLFSSQHYDIIASGVILNPNILRDCIALMHPPPHVAAERLLVALERLPVALIFLSLSNPAPSLINAPSSLFNNAPSRLAYPHHHLKLFHCL